MPQHSISARYGNVNNHYITSLWIYNWSLFYSSYFSVLPYFVQWIYISFVIREKKILQRTDTGLQGIFLWVLTIDNSLRPALTLRGSQWSFCRQSLDKNGPKSQVAGIFRSLTPSGSGPVQALEMCHTWGFLASQNQLFPSLTLVSSAFAIASKSLSLSPSLPPSLLSWLKLSWVKGAFLTMPCFPGGWGMVWAFSILLMATLRPRCCPSQIQCFLPLMFTPSGYITLSLALSLVCVDFQVTLKYSLRIQIREPQPHGSCLEELLLPS